MTIELQFFTYAPEKASMWQFLLENLRFTVGV
jgi:hypothetical protein